MSDSQQDTSMSAIQQQLDSYYQFKKNLLIQEVLFYNRDALEIPDIVTILLLESIYNVHTGKLIIAGGSPEGFKDVVTKAFPKIDLSTMKKIDILVESLSIMDTRGIIEHIPAIVTVEEYLKTFAESE